MTADEQSAVATAAAGGNATDGEALPTIADDVVVTKYKMAGEITNRILKEVIDLCQPGKSVREICMYSDNRIVEETGKAFKKSKNLQKGIAFPTCLSVNHCICHFSPLETEPDVVLSDGDVVKIDTGCHIDGFIAVVAHTLIVGHGGENQPKIAGRKADAYLAAHQACEAMLRLIKPGTEVSTVSEAVQKVADSYECKPVEGILSHQLEQNIIDGAKTVIQNPTEAQRKEHDDSVEFETHEVYALDVIISTGEGKGREHDTKTTIFKRTDETYMLKLKHAREFYSAISKKHAMFPFNLRSCENATRAKMGVVECVAHHLLDPYQVLYEKEGEFVCQFKFTVLLMPNGAHRITGLPPIDLANVETDKKVDSEIEKLLKTSANPKSAKRKKKQADKLTNGKEAPPQAIKV